MLYTQLYIYLLNKKALGGDISPRPPPVSTPLLYMIYKEINVSVYRSIRIA